MQDGNKNINLFFPRSHCVLCSKAIRPKNLIPIFSFLLQKGKCDACKEPISLMYPLNELLHLLVGLLLYFILGLNAQLFIAYIVFFSFFILFILDYKYFLLPFWLNLGMVLVGFIAIGIYETFTIPSLGFNQLYISLSGLFVGFFALWLINKLYKVIRGIDGIGGGDFILLSSIGSLVGIFALPFVLLLGSLSALMIYFLKGKSTRPCNTSRVWFCDGILIVLFIAIF